MAGPDPILILAGARLAIEPAGGLTTPIDLTVGQDELVVLDLAGPRRSAAFADAVAGVLPPGEGHVMFLGRDWRDETPEKAQALRGRIGRSFAAEAWLPWLSVPDNVLLGATYHTRIPRAALLVQAASLARRFGLPGLPVGFPEAVAPRDLVRIGVARAFLGAPRMVVLENPVGTRDREILPGLLTAIRKVRDDGGAVLWLTHETSFVADRTLPATQRWRLIGNRLVPVMARAA